MMTSFLGFGKEIYFYTNSTTLIQNVKVKIYNGGKQVLELRESEWIRLDVGNVKSYFLEFKSGTYMSNKKLNINLSTKEVAFVRIDLAEMGWRVYEQNPESAPVEIQDDFLELMANKILDLNIKNHPKTEWTEYKVKAKLDSKSDEIEGVYEGAFSGSTMAKYKLGVIKEPNSSYKVIYLGGGDPKIWKTGDLKATLVPTATNYFFKANWYMSTKYLNDEMYISFKEGSFSVIEKDDEFMFVKMYPIAKPSTSTGGISSGTGFALNEFGYIVTNHHVVENGADIVIKGVNNDFSKSYKARVVASDPKNDLAILKISDSQFSKFEELPYSLELKVDDVGSSVFTLGYPLRDSMGDEVKLTNGIISSKTGFQGDVTTYQVSTPVQPGNSGGPLFDDEGNVIGIISAKHTGAEGVSYAIKTLYLYNLMQSIDEINSYSESNTVSGLSLSGKVKTLKNYVFIIESK